MVLKNNDFLKTEHSSVSNLEFTHKIQFSVNWL